MAKRIEVGTIVYSNCWHKTYKVAEINPNKANTDDYIILKWEGQAPWHCNKKTWDRLLKSGDTVIKEFKFTESDVARHITIMMQDIQEVVRIRPLKDLVVVDQNNELVIKYNDGSEFIITIIQK